MDSSESALATIGLTKVLNGDMPYVGVMLQRVILAYPKRIERACEDLVFDRLPMKFKMPRPFGWEKMLVMFSQPIPESTIEKIHGKFPANLQDQANQFISYLARAYKHVADMLPVTNYETLWGAQEPLQPTGDALWQFYNRYWVIDDPLIVLSLAQAGALLPEQVSALVEFYPTMYDAIKDALLTALLKRKASDKQFLNLPPRAQMGCSVLLQQRTVSFQSNQHKVPPPKIPGQTAPGQPNKTLETPGQKAASVG